jgi:hypothetical protein
MNLMPTTDKYYGTGKYYFQMLAHSFKFEKLFVISSDINLE